MQVLISTPHQHILVYDMWWPGGMVNYSVNCYYNNLKEQNGYKHFVFIGTFPLYISCNHYHCSKPSRAATTCHKLGYVDVVPKLVPALTLFWTVEVC